jgi:CBS domain-containing protein
MTATPLPPRPVIVQSDGGGSILDRPVRTVMRPGVVVVPQGASVLRAQRAMLAHGVDAILVVGRANGRPLGWATARDMLRCLDADTALMEVSSLLTGPPVTIDPGATMAQAATALAAAPGVPLLVVKPGEVIPEGTVTERDIVRADAAVA